jgi:hypothetical protein
VFIFRKEKKRKKDNRTVVAIETTDMFMSVRQNNQDKTV